MKNFGFIVVSGVGLCFFFLFFGRFSLLADPVNLNAPANTIGASDPYGFLKVWEEIEDVDFGGNLKLPLRISISSSKVNSPYLGSGWSMPLLEAKAYLKRPTMLQAVLPCGKTMFLRKERSQQNLFHSLDHIWTGKIEGTTIKISRSDGWEIQFKDGNITQLRTDTGRILNWVRKGSLVTEVREHGGDAPFSLLNSPDGGIDGFRVNGKDHIIKFGQRPMVEEINGKRLVGRLLPSLESWKWPQKKEVKYLVELEMPSFNSLLKITKGDGSTETYTWESISGHLFSEGDWKYSIGAIDKLYALPRIERKDSKGNSEFIHVDNRIGITEQSTLRDGHTVTETFTSVGPLYGKVNKIQFIDVGGESRTIYQASYDELGRLRREMNSTGLINTYAYSDGGKKPEKKVIKTSDPKILEKIRFEETKFLEQLKSIPGQYEKDLKIQEIASFYIDQKGDIESALALISKVKDRNIAFNISLVAVNNDFHSWAEKIDGYKQLLVQFPEQKEHLDWLINRSSLKIKK